MHKMKFDPRINYSNMARTPGGVGERGGERGRRKREEGREEREKRKGRREGARRE